MTIDKKFAAKILSKFDKARILVIGDLILDEFIWGDADRISPEAPVPVVWAKSRSYLPGGASNVASNIASLGAKAVLCGVIGEDRNGQILKEKLHEKHVNCDGVITDPLRLTTLKTRIIAAHQQVVRLDWESVDQLLLDRAKVIIEAIEGRINEIDALIIEDYGKGLITPFLLKKVIALAKKHKKIITVDPKVEHFNYYKGVTAMTPNEKEASAGSGIKIATDEDVEKVGYKLLKSLKCEGVLITRGEKGMRLFRNDETVSIPTVAQEVFDVSGAGDTVISVFTLALSCGAKMRHAAELANVAAGIVVGKVGVAVVTKEEILQGLGQLKYSR
ncbi:MAG: D-glycero-beta-D-manno-heptose-7-phosphate kinase [Candidatus Omnitrophota bacterium]